MKKLKFRKVGSRNIVYTSTNNDDRGYTNGLYFGPSESAIKILQRPWVLSDVADSRFKRAMGVDCRSDLFDIPIFNYECALLE